MLVEVLSASLIQPPLRTRPKKYVNTFLGSLVVEVPGIEPGSFRIKTGLLRA